MKGWIVGALAVTFFAGMTSGVLFEKQTAEPPVQKTWIDGCIQQLRADGVTDEADIEEARQVYARYNQRVLAFRTKVDALLRDQLQQLADEAEQDIRAIRARYPLEK